MLRHRGSGTQNWVSLTELMMWIGYRKGIQKADVSSPSLERRANAQSVRFWNSFTVSKLT